MQDRFRRELSATYSRHPGCAASRMHLAGSWARREGSKTGMRRRAMCIRKARGRDCSRRPPSVWMMMVRRKVTTVFELADSTNPGRISANVSAWPPQTSCQVPALKLSRFQERPNIHSSALRDPSPRVCPIRKLGHQRLPRPTNILHHLGNI